MRYCARPPFAQERLRKEGAALVYRCAKQHSEPVGGKAAHITLTPLELIDRIAALVPPPRTHRHRYYGVLAPNSPLRAAVTAMAQAAAVLHTPSVPARSAAGGGGGLAPPAIAMAQPEPQSEAVPPKRSPAHYLWAALIARIYEVFPLICPIWRHNRHLTIRLISV